MCISLCIIVAHNTAQNRPDNFPSYPPDNHLSSDDVYLREGGRQEGLLDHKTCTRDPACQLLTDPGSHGATPENQATWTKSNSSCSSNVSEKWKWKGARHKHPNHLITMPQITPGIELVQALADTSRVALCCYRTKPMHRLQIRPIVYN